MQDLIVNVGAHWGIANTAALRAAGIPDTAEDPVGGSYGRDGAGLLKGLLYEQALFDLAYPSLARGVPASPPHSLDARVQGMEQASRMFLAAGITSVTPDPPSILSR